MRGVYRNLDRRRLFGRRGDNVGSRGVAVAANKQARSTRKQKAKYRYILYIY